MITGSEQESRKLMMDAAVSIVARYGFEGFTTKRWAAKAGVAEGSLYYHFKGKRDLLEQTFFYIDGEITEAFGQILKILADNERGESTRALVSAQWKRCFAYLVHNPEKTLYYYRFCSSPRYDDRIQQEQYLLLEKMLNDSQEDGTGESDGGERDAKRRSNAILWTYMIDTTAAFAFRVITRGADADETAQNEMVQLFLQGVLPEVSTQAVSDAVV